MSNPLLAAWQTPFETPPFDDIKPEHFMAAFEQAFADHTAEVAAIVNDPSDPDFDNTITALERSGKLLTKVSSVFYALVGAHSNPELLAIESDVALRQARHWNPIMMNGVLFSRIAKLFNQRSALKLTGEQQRLLERSFIRFRRSARVGGRGEQIVTFAMPRGNSGGFAQRTRRPDSRIRSLEVMFTPEVATLTMSFFALMRTASAAVMRSILKPPSVPR